MENDNNGNENPANTSGISAEMMAHAAKVLGGEPAAPAAPAEGDPEIGNPAASAAAAPAADASNPDLNKPDPAAAAATPTSGAAPSAAAPDNNAILDQISGGVFKDVDSFVAALPKLKEYDQINARKTELEAEIAKDPFASPFVKTLNKLVAEGAPIDQIKSFIAINESPSLGDLDPKEAKVMKMVLVDGMKETVARRKVDGMFNLDDPSLSAEQKEDLEEDLRISSKNDLKELEAFKADLSVVKGTKDEQNLQSAAQRQAYSTHLQTVVPQISSAITGLGEVKLAGDKGIPDVVMAINYSDDFKASIPKQLEAYFMDGLTPINKETVVEAVTTIHARYLVNNYQKMMEDFGKQVRAETLEYAEAKFENRSGIQNDEKNPNNPITADQQFKSFQERVASGGMGSR